MCVTPVNDNVFFKLDKTLALEVRYLPSLHFKPKYVCSKVISKSTCLGMAFPTYLCYMEEKE